MDKGGVGPKPRGDSVPPKDASESSGVEKEKFRAILEERGEKSLEATKVKISDEAVKREAGVRAAEIAKKQQSEQATKENQSGLEKFKEKHPEYKNLSDAEINTLYRDSVGNKLKALPKAFLKNGGMYGIAGAGIALALTSVPGVGRIVGMASTAAILVPRAIKIVQQNKRIGQYQDIIEKSINEAGSLDAARMAADMIENALGQNSGGKFSKEDEAKIIAKVKAKMKERGESEDSISKDAVEYTKLKFNDANLSSKDKEVFKSLTGEEIKEGTEAYKTRQAFSDFMFKVVSTRRADQLEKDSDSKKKEYDKKIAKAQEELRDELEKISKEYGLSDNDYSDLANQIIKDFRGAFADQYHNGKERQEAEKKAAMDAIDDYMDKNFKYRTTRFYDISGTDKTDLLEANTRTLVKGSVVLASLSGIGWQIANTLGRRVANQGVNNFGPSGGLATTAALGAGIGFIFGGAAGALNKSDTIKRQNAEQAYSDSGDAESRQRRADDAKKLLDELKKEKDNNYQNLSKEQRRLLNAKIREAESRYKATKELADTSYDRKNVYKLTDELRGYLDDNGDLKEGVDQAEIIKLLADIEARELIQNERLQKGKRINLFSYGIEGEDKTTSREKIIRGLSGLEKQEIAIKEALRNANSDDYNLEEKVNELVASIKNELEDGISKKRQCSPQSRRIGFR